jgi:hypothetical protein
MVDQSPASETKPAATNTPAGSTLPTLSGRDQLNAIVGLNLDETKLEGEARNNFDAIAKKFQDTFGIALPVDFKSYLVSKMDESTDMEALVQGFKFSQDEKGIFGALDTKPEIDNILKAFENFKKLGYNGIQTGKIFMAGAVAGGVAYPANLVNMDPSKGPNLFAVQNGTSADIITNTWVTHLAPNFIGCKKPENWQDDFKACQAKLGNASASTTVAPTTSSGNPTASSSTTVAPQAVAPVPPPPSYVPNNSPQPVAHEEEVVGRYNLQQAPTPKQLAMLKTMDKAGLINFDEQSGLVTRSQNNKLARLDGILVDRTNSETVLLIDALIGSGVIGIKVDLKSIGVSQEAELSLCSNGYAKSSTGGDLKGHNTANSKISLYNFGGTASSFFSPDMFDEVRHDEANGSLSQINANQPLETLEDKLIKANIALYLGMVNSNWVPMSGDVTLVPVVSSLPNRIKINLSDISDAEYEYMTQLESAGVLKYETINDPNTGEQCYEIRSIYDNS